jgi:hypothetical protein
MPNNRVKGTKQLIGNTRVLQDPNLLVLLRVTNQSGPQGAIDATSLQEASKTATPNNTIVVELPKVVVGSQLGDLPKDPDNLITLQGKKLVREDRQDKSQAWPANNKPTESPY